MNLALLGLILCLGSQASGFSIMGKRYWRIPFHREDELARPTFRPYQEAKRSWTQHEKRTASFEGEQGNLEYEDYPQSIEARDGGGKMRVDPERLQALLGKYEAVLRELALLRFGDPNYRNYFRRGLTPPTSEIIQRNGRSSRLPLRFGRK